MPSSDAQHKRKNENVLHVLSTPAFHGTSFHTTDNVKQGFVQNNRAFVTVNENIEIKTE